MAYAQPPVVSSKDKTNYARLCRLLVDVGWEALRDTFDSIHPPAELFEVLIRPPVHPTLQSLKKKRILSPTQWRKLYPSVSSAVSSANFDITLLTLLLRNICGLSPPASTGSWDVLPPSFAMSIEANIARVKFYRDNVYWNARQDSVDDQTFNTYWQDISNALIGLGAGSSYWNTISRIKTESMDPDTEQHYKALLKEWKKDDDNVQNRPEGIKGMQKKWKANEDNTEGKLEEMRGTETEVKQNQGSFQCNVIPPRLAVKLLRPGDISVTTKPWDDAELPIDILLLTVENCEFLSCLLYLDNHFKSYRKDIGFVYFGSMGGDEQEKLKIALIKYHKGSEVPGGSLIVVKNAVRVLRPKAVFSVGSCIGLNSEKTALGDVVVSSKLTTSFFKTPVSKHIGKIITNVDDGWKAPLEDPDALDVRVHCGDVLSQPQVSQLGWRQQDIIQHYPEAIAVETEGEGVFATAHDDKMEWVIVKGIAGYGDLSQSSSEGWMSFASSMAASLVAHILCDPVVFQGWPHYHQDKIADEPEQVKTNIGSISEKLDNLGMSEEESREKGAFDPSEFINGFCQLYKIREGWLAPFPWCEDFRFHLDSVFTRLKIVSRKKERGRKTGEIANMFDIFKPHEECRQPRTVLIEAKPGMGKTTYCQKLAYDWATKTHLEKSSFPEVKVVLFLKCRDIESDLWEAIDDQLLPRDIQEKERDEFFKFIRHNQSNVLLVLDGLDELPTGKLQLFKEIIQGRMLPKCHLVVTAREEAAIKVRECCDTLLVVEGFTKEDAQEFITKYFKTMEDLAEKLLDELDENADLVDLTANPLNTALLCLLCDDFNGVFPESRTQLYLEIVECVLRRYRKKKGLPETNEDLIEVYEAQLKHLGSIAFNGLLEDSMYFEDRQLQNLVGNLPGFGFLSVQPGSSKRRPSMWYGFLHKSFQELFAAFYLCCQLLDGEISPKSLLADTRYFDELKQVLFFTCGILAAQCEETTVTFITRIMSVVKKGDDEDFVTALYCINECKTEQSNLHIKLAGVLGSLLELKNSLDLKGRLVNAAAAAVLAEAIKRNSTLTELNLRLNGIYDAGATALAEALKTNTTLTMLDLTENFEISDLGATALAEAIQTNSTLTGLNLSKNEIEDAGATALAKALQKNSNLRVLNLSDNCIGDTGAAALAEAIQTNSTLALLKLCHNNIGENGIAALAEAIKINSTITVKWDGYDSDSDFHYSDYPDYGDGDDDDDDEEEEEEEEEEEDD